MGGGDRVPTDRDVLEKVAKQTEKAQRMTVLIGFSLMVASFLLVLSMVRQELRADALQAHLQRADKRVEDMQDMQRLQSMALQRIGGIAVRLEEEVAALKARLGETPSPQETQTQRGAGGSDGVCDQGG